jgi:hypothetical protein
VVARSSRSCWSHSFRAPACGARRDRSGRTFADQDQGCGQDGAARAENAITLEVVAGVIKTSPAAPTEARGIRQTDGIIGGVSATQRLL